MNTENVQLLSVTATKPALHPSPDRKRTTTSPVAEQALIAKPAVRVPETRTFREATAAAAAQIETYLRSIGRQVQFSIDTASGRTVVSVRDANTGDVIRQIPSEEALRLAHALGSKPNSLIDIEA